MTIDPDELTLLFGELSRQDTEERAAALARVARSDPELAAELSDLLGHADGESPLDQPILDRAHGEAMAPTLSTPALKIPGYRILHELGRGGFGTVYEAEQDQPRRRVAIKLMRPGFAGDGALRRFELEAELLGRLNHQSVARVFEAGTVELELGPHPYLVMEKISGCDLTTYVVAECLDTDQRISLLITALDGIAHAHARGVIHRDLKPSNILVDGEGKAHLVDFGVARMLEVDLAGAPPRTKAGELVGTLQYMSPEQARGKIDEVDVQSDLYSFGIVMYEILSERLPYVVDSASLDDAIRNIVHVDPLPLASVAKHIPRDLEIVVAKALAKDKEHRYRTAHELRDDLRRVLAKEPIAARRPGFAEHLRRYARTHRTQFFAGAALALSLLVGIVGNTINLRKARQATRVAESRLAETEAVNRLLRGVFLAVDPAIVGREVTARDLLAEAARQIPLQLASQPARAAEAHGLLGRAFNNVGDDAAAERHFIAERDLYLGLEGEDSEDAMSAELSRLRSFDVAGRFGEARALLNRVLPRLEKKLGPTHPKVVTARGNLATYDLRDHRWAEAEAALRECLEVAASRSDFSAEARANLHLNLGNALRSQMELQAAREQYTKALELAGDRKGTGLSALTGLTGILSLERNYEEALQITEATLELSLRLYGSMDIRTLVARHSHARILILLGRREEGKGLLESDAASIELHYGPDAPILGDVKLQLATYYLTSNRVDEAEMLLRQVIERTEGRPDRKTQRYLAMKDLGPLLHYQGEHEKAIEAMEATDQEDVERFGMISAPRKSTLYFMAQAHYAAGQYDDALDRYHELVELELRFGGPSAGVASGIAEVHSATGQSAEARPWLFEAAWLARKTYGDRDYTLKCELDLGMCLRAEGDLRSAEAIFTKIVANSMGSGDNLGDQANAACRELAKILLKEGRIAEARGRLCVAYEAHLAAFGAEHPNTVGYANWLAHLDAAEAREDGGP